MTALHAPRRGFFRNLRDLPAALSLSGFIAGLLVVITGYTGPILLVLGAAEAGGLSAAETASWIWAVAVGDGVMTMLLSLYYRQPIIAPWSTAGVAVLAAALPSISLPQAVGAYIVCGLAVAALGASGLFARALALVPTPVITGVIAGILLTFGKGVYTALGSSDPVIVAMAAAMIAVFFIMKRRQSRAPTVGSLLAGGVIAALAGRINLQGVPLELTQPLLIMPEFDLNAILTIGLPSLALALTSQYAPGQAVLRTAGYDAPINGILTSTGLASVALAFFGGHGVTLGALTAALVAAPDSEPDPDRRYASAFVSGAFYTLFGFFGVTIFAFFAGFPPVLVSVVAGLALTGTITSGLTNATSSPNGRDAGIAAFLCTASEMRLLGIAAPFWGLVLGVIIYTILNHQRPQADER